MAFESHDASRAVAECGTKSVFDQITVSPSATVTAAGTNTKFWIETLCVRGVGRVQLAIAPVMSPSTTAAYLACRLTYFASDA